MPDLLTHPAVLAAVSVGLYLLAKKRPALAAALAAAWKALQETSKPDAEVVSGESVPVDVTRCNVLKGIRHDISEQEDPEQRAKDLALCDEFRTMLKRLSEPKVAA